MNTELFIARRILQGNKNQSRLSRPIVLISLISITLGLAVMIITISVVTGFQEGVREKVIGFGSHIQVTSVISNNAMESSPLLIAQDFYPSIEEEENVRKIQPFAYKSGIIQRVKEADSHSPAGDGSPVVDMQGVSFKGVDANYDWSFFSDKMVDGGLIDFTTENSEVLISEYISLKLSYKVGDTMDVFFIQERPVPRKFVVKGIYRTGFEQFDKQLIFTQLAHVQKLNNWGVQTFLTVLDTCIDGQFVVEARTKGGTGSYKYDWGRGFGEGNLMLVDGSNVAALKVISSDYKLSATGNMVEMNSVPDTAWAKIQIDSSCACTEENVAMIEYISESEIRLPNGKMSIQNGSGTSSLYTGGFEIMIEDWDDLAEMDEIIDENIPWNLETTKITEMHEDIFGWLDFLDLNIFIIIVLVLIVSLMNMITSLLVLILEKTNMIGILKASGAMNGSIRRIFTYHSMFLLGRGLLFGNILGIGIILAQHYFGLMKLDPEVYYLDHVPVNINVWHILLINVITIVVCRIILILPSLLVSKIMPAKVIRFN